jgi:hypothetical protein
MSNSPLTTSLPSPSSTPAQPRNQLTEAEVFATPPEALDDPLIAVMVASLRLRYADWQKEEATAKATGRVAKSKAPRLTAEERAKLLDTDLGDLS